MGREIGRVSVDSHAVKSSEGCAVKTIREACGPLLCPGRVGSLTKFASDQNDPSERMALGGGEQQPRGVEDSRVTESEDSPPSGPPPGLWLM